MFGSIQESGRLHHKYFFENVLKNTHNFGEQSKRFQILKNVTGLGGDQQHVQLLHRLINIANGVRFHECMLFA